LILAATQPNLIELFETAVQELLDDWGNGVLVDASLHAIRRAEPLSQWLFMSAVATVATPTDPRRIVAGRVEVLDRRVVTSVRTVFSVRHEYVAIHAVLISPPQRRQDGT
jgi:hypothetical protein